MNWSSFLIGLSIIPAGMGLLIGIVMLCLRWNIQPKQPDMWVLIGLLCGAAATLAACNVLLKKGAL